MREDMAAEISVIVPVYNTEKYVEECIESVLAQTYTDFELILIDDGSEDNSREICREMGRKDDRIRLIQMEHRGVSAARNAGMDAAVGKYLFFLDSDDMIHPQLLEALYEVQEKMGTAIAMENLYYAEEKKLNFVEWEIGSNTRESIYLCNEKAIEHLSRNSKIELFSIGGKMVLSNRLETIKFDETLSNGEDTLFLYQLLISGADASILLRKWYYYRRYGQCASRVFSAKTCKSRYVVNKYINEQEVKNGRIINATWRKWVIFGELIEWHEIGRKNQDSNLMRYVKYLLNTEVKSEMLSDFKWYNKLEVYTGVYCYPIFKLVYKWINDIKSYKSIYFREN